MDRTFQLANPTLPMADPSRAFDWDDLLLLIEERRVIPIVGPELVLVHGESGPERLDRLIARRLAERLGVGAEQTGPQPTLDQVASAHLRHGGRPLKIYSGIKALMMEPELKEARPPEPLLQLASIRDFQLFVSTTFDSMLARALDEVRYEGNETTRELAYTTKGRVKDLPHEVADLGVPHVYHIFGPLSSAPDFAVTDRDTLEVLHRLQGSLRRPQILFDELRALNLLFLGCDFPNWLSRFFVRTLANQSLGVPRDTAEVVADTESAQESSLSLFFEDCDIDTFPSGSAVEFVETLYEKWCVRNPDPVSMPQEPTRHASGGDERLAEPLPLVRAAGEARGSDMVEGAVFLSYANEDLGTVISLWQALDGGQVDVWFDRRELAAGAAWDAMIESNILRCSLFLPVVSRNAQARLEGYFRQEWAWAVKRAGRMARELPFIVPMLLDLEPGADFTPREFWGKQTIALLPDGVTDHVVRQVRALVQKRRAMELGLR